MSERARLYVILGSHACRTGMLLLEHKGIEYRPVELPTGLHPLALRVLGLHGNREPLRDLEGRRPYLLAAADRMGTVPALRLDGGAVMTNARIARFLDELQPDPPLFPAGPSERAAVEEAERWGDKVLQMVARRIVLGTGLRNGGESGRLGTMLYRNALLRRGLIAFIRRFAFDSDAQTAARLCAQVPALLDRVDAWIGEGILGAEQLNAADYMIVTSLGLLSYADPVRPQLEGRPLTRLLDRVLPEPVT
jgi:glutathione S-transferase